MIGYGIQHSMSKPFGSILDVATQILPSTTPLASSSEINDVQYSKGKFEQLGRKNKENGKKKKDIPLQD